MLLTAEPQLLSLEGLTSRRQGRSYPPSSGQHSRQEASGLLLEVPLTKASAAGPVKAWAKPTSLSPGLCPSWLRRLGKLRVPRLRRPHPRTLHLPRASAAALAKSQQSEASQSKLRLFRPRRWWLLAVMSLTPRHLRRRKPPILPDPRVPTQAVAGSLSRRRGPARRKISRHIGYMQT